MANEQVATNLYVDTTTSQVDIQIRNLKVIGVILNNHSTPATVELTIANYDASSPKTVAKFRISSSELTKYFDLKNTPIVLPDGLAVPASGLTSGASATIIYEG